MSNTDKLSKKYIYGANKNTLSNQAVEVLNTILEKIKEQFKKGKSTDRVMLHSMEYNIIKKMVVCDYLRMIELNRLGYNEVFLLSKGSSCKVLVDKVVNLIQESRIEEYGNIPKKKEDIVDILIQRHIEDKNLPYEIIEVNTTCVPITKGSKKELRAVPINNSYSICDIEEVLKKKGIACMTGRGYVEILCETDNKVENKHTNIDMFDAIDGEYSV